MKRSAFNMIELIFVIIILGILSAVVVVKMSNMNLIAKETQLKSFIGTLNRSVGPALWFNSKMNKGTSSIAFADYDSEIDRYTELIPNYTSGPSFVNCNASGDGIFLSYTFGNIYEIHCADGNVTSSPNFKLYNLTDSTYIE